MLTSLHLRGEVAVAGRVGRAATLGSLGARAPGTPKRCRRARPSGSIGSIDSARSAFDSGDHGWEAHPDAVDGDVPDRVTFLSPFDRLIHDRDRAQALFGFHYRLEMFVPKAKRVYGYYVLPILRGTEIIGRIEPVFDRTRGVLRVEGVWAEPERPPTRGPASGTPPTGSPAGSVRSRSRSGRRCRARGQGAPGVSPDYHPPMDFETRAIHVGQEPDPATGSVVTPIYQTSTFAQEAVGVNKGYDYARVANPTRTALEECLASLENAGHGHAFSSGSARR